MLKTKVKLEIDKTCYLTEQLFQTTQIKNEFNKPAIDPNILNNLTK